MNLSSFTRPRLRETPARSTPFLILYSCAVQKLGVDEEIFVVDLKKGEVTKGPSFSLVLRPEFWLPRSVF